MTHIEPIAQMYAFVVDDEDAGVEGVLAFPGPNKMMMPMVGADMERVDQMRGMAEIMSTALNKPVKVLRFSTREVLEVITPRT